MEESIAATTEHAGKKHHLRVPDTMTKIADFGGGVHGNICLPKLHTNANFDKKRSILLEEGVDAARAGEEYEI